MKKTRSFLSACFFLCGLACFASLPWAYRVQRERLLEAEPYYRCPVVVYSNRVLIRNDAYGKGRFGVSRGDHGQRSHKGVDLLTRVGSPSLAAKSGRVIFAGTAGGYGWHVKMIHPDGRITCYAHLSRLFVTAGDWATSGQSLGLCGKSGNANDRRIQPHLHFEIREGKEAMDPLKLFDPTLIFL